MGIENGWDDGRNSSIYHGVRNESRRREWSAEPPTNSVADRAFYTKAFNRAASKSADPEKLLPYSSASQIVGHAPWARCDARGGACEPREHTFFAVLK